MSTAIDPSQGLRILIVEDEALIAEEILERLSRLHYQVVGITDTGAKAIELAHQKSPDLILMDIRLKGQMDGIQAGEHIYRTLNIPVIYLTAQADKATFQRAVLTSPFGYLLKPFQEKDLVVALELAQQRRRMEQQLKASELTYATMVTSIADGVIATDAEGRVCFLNPMAETLMGCRSAEVEGLPVEQVLKAFPETVQEASEHPVVQALRRRCTIALTEPYVWIERDEAAIPIEGNASPVVDTLGRVTGSVVVFRDITQRQQMEAQIACQMEMLRERSTCLEAQQAELVQKQAELLLSNQRLARTNAKLGEAVQHLEALATTDGLTGLKNHRAFQEQLTEECLRAQRYHLPLSLILLDVDHFKQFNDTFGHPAGDVALKQVADIVKSCVRQTDIPARYGGEEFAVLLPSTDKAGALRTAERIRLAVVTASWEHCPLTVSLGIATFGERAATASTLLEAADQALYHSKSSGRNRSTHVAEMPGRELEAPQGGLSTPYADLLQEMISIQMDMLTSASTQLREIMAQAYDTTVVGWSRMLDLKDRETEGHSGRVTEMMERLAKRIGMNPEEALYVRWGALLHDVGKMSVPDPILHKSGALTEEEQEVMQKHPVVAYELLSPVSFLRPALEIPYAHHEKWNGTGYPQGLCGEEIPMAARLFAIVDMYDELTHDRPYRKAWTKKQTLKHIRSLQGTHFDPRAVKVFLSEFEGT